MSSGSGLTPIGEAFLAASQLREAVEDLSAADINRMSFSEYARIRESAGLPSIDPFSEVYSPEPPGRPRSAQDDPGRDPQPEPIDLQAMGMAEYAAIRNRYIRPSSGTGRGLFD
jgi:hypothetical protein